MFHYLSIYSNIKSVADHKRGNYKRGGVKFKIGHSMRFAAHLHIPQNTEKNTDNSWEIVRTTRAYLK